MNGDVIRNVAWFKAYGDQWQRRMQAALRYMLKPIKHINEKPRRRDFSVQRYQEDKGVLEIAAA